MLKKRKGDALAVAIATAAAVTVIGVASTKLFQMNSNADYAVRRKLEVSMYAESRIEILKNTRYDDLSDMGKTKIEGTEYYESVSLSNHIETEPAGRWATVSIYEGNKDTPVDTFRYFCLKEGLPSVPKGTILMWGGITIPKGWVVCDGRNGTPDMRDRFIMGSSNQTGHKLGNTGGVDKVRLSVAQMAGHTHRVRGSNSTNYVDDKHSHTRGTWEISGRFIQGSWGSGHDWGITSGAFQLTGGSSGRCANKGDSRGVCDFKASRTWTGRTAVASHVHTIGGIVLKEDSTAGQEHENRPLYYAVYYIMKL